MSLHSASACARDSRIALRAFRALRVELAKHGIEGRAECFPLRLIAIATAVAGVAPALLQRTRGGNRSALHVPAVSACASAINADLARSISA